MPHKMSFRTNIGLWVCACTIVFLLGLVSCQLMNSGPVVHTKWGRILGKVDESFQIKPNVSRRFASFLGVPYALPPVGDLRFRSPQPWNRTWFMIRDATSYGKTCIQFIVNKLDLFYSIVGSEDCLSVNIFVPEIDTHNFTKLPVLVFVHGGSYLTGTSKEYGPQYLMNQDIILVTLNYRLTVFGFFSTGNQASPGNYGLKDITMALRWVQENIESFNGDPRRVTVMGHSAGSAAVHLLALSKKTEGLFDKYILLSGSANAPWNLHSRKIYRYTCLKFARMVGCLPGRNATENLDGEIDKIDNIYNGIPYSHNDLENDEKIMKCMRTINERTLINEVRSFMNKNFQTSCVFGPTLEDESEDAVMTMHPIKVLKDGLFRDIPVLTQMVKDEGLMKKKAYLLVFNNGGNNESKYVNNFGQFLLVFLDYQEVIPDIFTGIFADAIEDFYFDGNVTAGLTENISEMSGDAILYWPTFQALQYQSKKGKSDIYLSLFAYEGSVTISYLSHMFPGVDHSDNLPYLFLIEDNFTLTNITTATDMAVTDIMTEMFANFVKEGVPKAQTIPAWPDYRDRYRYVKIGDGKSPNVTMESDFLLDRMKFWEKLLANITAKTMEHDDVSVKAPDNVGISNCYETLTIDCLVVLATSLVKLFFSCMS